MIKIRRSSKNKERIILPFKKIKVNKNYNKDDDDNFELIYSEIKNDNDNDDINKNINIDENKNAKILTTGNDLGKDLKSYSPLANERNNKFFESILNRESYNSEKGDKKMQRVKFKGKTSKEEGKKIDSYSSALDINNNNNKNDKKTLDNSKSSKKPKNMKINTLKKSSNSKKIFNYPSKKFFSSPKNISFNNSQNSSPYNPQNTIETNYKNNKIKQDNKSIFFKIIKNDNDNNINNINENNTIENIKFKTIENVN